MRLKHGTEDPLESMPYTSLWVGIDMNDVYSSFVLSSGVCVCACVCACVHVCVCVLFS